MIFSKKILGLILVSLFLFVKCEKVAEELVEEISNALHCGDTDDCEEIDCYYETEPDWCSTSDLVDNNVNVHVSINDENPFVLFKLFEGRIENNNLLLQDSIRTSTSYIVKLPKGNYTAVAIYKVKNENYVRLASFNIRPKSCQYCCYTCYESNDYIVRLKYNP